MTTIKLNFDSEYKLEVASVGITAWGDGGTSNVDARRPALMNLKVAADPNAKVADVSYAILTIDGDTYRAEVKSYEASILTLNYLQPENKIGDKLTSLVLHNAAGTVISYVSSLPVINSTGVNIPGNPTQSGYDEIIAELTFN